MALQLKRSYTLKKICYLLISTVTLLLLCAIVKQSYIFSVTLFSLSERRLLIWILSAFTLFHLLQHFWLFIHSNIFCIIHSHIWTINLISIPFRVWNSDIDEIPLVCTFSMVIFFPSMPVRLHVLPWFHYRYCTGCSIIKSSSGIIFFHMIIICYYNITYRVLTPKS